LFWNCFPPFDSSPNGEPLIGERIRQAADFPPLKAGGWKLTAPFSSWQGATPQDEAFVSS
jgi:hypothetical protein